MKRITMLLLLLTAVSLVGCAEEIKGNDTSSCVEIINEWGDAQMQYISKIAKIQIADSISGAYKQDMLIDVDDSLIDQFIIANESILADESSVLRTPMYDLKLYDETGSLLSVWTVDVFKIITTSDGLKINRKNNEKLDAFLSKIEAEYNLQQDLFKRVPGENYYSMLENASSVYFNSQERSQFDGDNNKIRYEVSTDAIYELKSNWRNIDISAFKSEGYSLKYTVNVYDANGISIYAIHIDNQNRIYTSYGYELTGDFISEWLESIMKEALNQ